MKGRLQDRSLESLMRDIQSRGASGVLTLTRGAIKKQICFVKGTVRFAASNLKEDRLAEFLIRSWALPEDQVREAEGKLEGRRLAEMLIASGALDPEMMRNHVRAHTLDVICPCFEWKDGDYRFQDGVPNIVGEMAADIVAQELALERARRQITGAQVEKVLSQKHMAIVPNRRPSGREDKPLKIPTTETFILERAASATTLEDLLRLSPQGEYEIARATAVLLQSGLIDLEKPQNVQSGPLYDTLRPGSKPTAAAAAKTAADAVPAEVRYYQQMYDLMIGADFYKTLSVDHDASPEEVRRAYYHLAKEIHPDHFLSPPLDALHSRMEELFSQVLEAYNTLVSPEARARYDTERAQSATAPRQASSDQQMMAKQNFVRGRMLVDENKPAEALKWLQNAVDVEPNKPEYQRLLALVQAKNPRLRREAEEHFLKAIELDPARADTYLQLGLLYRRTGEMDKAVARLRECLKWDPANAEAGTALAEIGSGAGAR